MSENYIQHYGIKGMKWGVRRYQNKDGSLTPAGKKRISKEYKKLSDKIDGELQRTYASRYIDAHNKAADVMNNGGIDRYNAKQRKKYGENYMDRDDYEENYMKEFEKLLSENYNKSLNEFFKNNADYKKSKELVDKYGMTKWDEVAKANEAAVNELSQIVEKYH